MKKFLSSLLVFILFSADIDFTHAKTTGEQRSELRKERLEQRKAKRMKKKHITPVDISIESSVYTVDNSPVTFTGKASYYADKFHGRKTASGEIFSNEALTAAHLTLPFGARVKVTNFENGNTIEVTINDRGPYTPGRILDLSKEAFSRISPLSRGVISVQIEILK